MQYKNYLQPTSTAFASRQNTRMHWALKYPLGFLGSLIAIVLSCVLAAMAYQPATSPAPLEGWQLLIAALALGLPELAFVIWWDYTIAYLFFKIAFRRGRPILLPVYYDINEEGKKEVGIGFSGSPYCTLECIPTGEYCERCGDPLCYLYVVRSGTRGQAKRDLGLPEPHCLRDKHLSETPINFWRNAYAVE